MQEYIEFFQQNMILSLVWVGLLVAFIMNIVKSATAAYKEINPWSTEGMALAKFERFKDLAQQAAEEEREAMAALMSESSRFCKRVLVIRQTSIKMPSFERRGL